MKLTTNTRAVRADYPIDLRSILSVAKAEESRMWLANWSGLRPGATPLYYLSSLARSTGVGHILMKDEAERSDLGSFKALGAPIALVRLTRRLWPEHDFNPVSILAGAYKLFLAALTVISATDGNHGRALAAAAQSAGCRCVIVLHAHVSEEREAAIAAYGADIVRVKGNYDESVVEAERLAKSNGWHVVSDTSYEGYEDIPRDVMQGYGTVAAEVVEALAGTQRRVTHVFLQGGVGGLAAGIMSYLWEVYGSDRPVAIVVEPLQADCLYQSSIKGRASKATGSVDSVMAGLACGDTSPLAWQFLELCVDHFMIVEDGDAIEAMQVLAKGIASDPPIVSGESGAAGLAGLIQLMRVPDLADLVGLNHSSSVLLLNTEGATAPSVYKKLVGESAERVVSRRGVRIA
jgi:diaminopropionate ammonia-lyase